MPSTGVAEEPILSRVDRLGNMLRYLKEIKSLNKTPRSSCESTPSSGTWTSEGPGSSLDSSPKSVEKHCRPIELVITQTEVKGTLIERLDQIECRVLKLEAEKKREEEKRPHKQKGLKQMVKQCVESNGGKHKKGDF